MSENTKIEWCDATFNPWEGCTKVGPGCDHCYAETRNARYGGGTAINWGPGAPRRRTSAANWAKPVAWNKEPFYQCACGWRGGEKSLDEQDGGIFDGLPACPSCDSVELQPARRRVFCASLADVFDNNVDPRWRAELFALIHKTPNLDWLLLTKRIGNVNSMVEEACDLLPVPEGYQSLWAQGDWPANVWLGATIVNQAEADRDIPKLLAVPARFRFLSMEPLLNHVDLKLMARSFGFPKHITREGHAVGMPQGIHWVIAGGESGPGARPMHPLWARSVRNQCLAAGVPFLFKQWGEWGPVDAQKKPPLQLDEWPKDGLAGTVVTYPNGNQYLFPVKKVGKKTAGRLLDEVEHNGFPE